MAAKGNVASPAKKGIGKKIFILLVIVAVIVVGYLVYKKMKEKSDLAKLMDPADPVTPPRTAGSGGFGASGGSGGSGGSGQTSTRENSTFPYVPKPNEYPMQMNARGPGISQLQKALGISADGKWGPKTETAAIEAFKERYPGKAVPKPFKIVNFTQYDAALKWLEFH